MQFFAGVFAGRGLSASRRNISLETALRKICKLNNVLTSYFLIGLIPINRFFGVMRCILISLKLYLTVNWETQ